MDIAVVGYQVETRGIRDGIRELDNLGRAGERVETQGRTAGGALDTSMRTAGGGVGVASGAVHGLSSRLGGLGTVIGGLGLGVLARDAFDAFRQFESMNASLKTVTGSADAAGEAFAVIKDFAATTPYDLEQAVGGFIKLKSLGLDPSIGALESYGNTASAMGKSLNDMIEAVADASVGEFERLKEFGIKAKSEGENVTLTFQGVSTTIGKNAEEITEYLRGIGDVQFAGAMSEQMDTLNGAVSNVGDAFNAFQVTLVAQSGAGDAAKAVLTGLADAISDATDMVVSGRERFDEFREALRISDDVPYVALRSLGDMLERAGQVVAPLIPYLDDFAIALAAIGGSAVGIGLIAGALTAVASVVLSPVVLAVAGLAAGAVLLRENWDGIASWWSGLWNGLPDETRAAFDRIVVVGEEAWEEIKGLFGGPELGDSVDQSMGGVVNAFAAGWGAVISGINAVAPVIADAADRALGFMIDIAPEIAEAWDNVFPRIIAVVKEGWAMITTVVSAAWPLIQSSVRTGLDVIVGIFDVALAAFRGDWQAMFDSIQDLLYGFVGNIVRGAGTLIGALAQVGMQIGSSLVGSISDAISAGKGILVEALAQLIENSLGLFGVGSKLADKFRSAMGELADDGVGGVVDGFERGGRDVADAAVELIEKVEPAMDQAVGRRSPWATTEAIGYDGALGLAIGIKSGGDVVADASVAIAGRVVQSFSVLDGALEDQFVLFEDGSFKAAAYFESFHDGAEAVEDAAATIGDLTRGADENFVIMSGGGVVLERYRDLMESVGIATFDAADSFGESGESAEQMGKKMGEAQAEVVSLQQQQAILALTMSDGAEAGETLRLQLEGYTPELAAARIEEEAMLEAMSERFEATERAEEHVRSLREEQRLQTIALTQGSDAAEAARLSTDHYSGALIDNVQQIERNMEMQQEFHSALVRSISSADSIKDAFSNLGEFMKNWLKEKIAYFLANKITAIVGIGTEGGGGLGGLLGGLGGGGSGADVSKGPLPGLGGGPMPGGGIGTYVAAAAGIAMVAKAIDEMGSLMDSWSSKYETFASNLRTAVGMVDTAGVEITDTMGRIGVEMPAEFASTLKRGFDGINWNASAEEIQARVEGITRSGYSQAYDTLGPELQARIQSSVDMATAPIADIEATFERLGAVATTVLPVLEQSGINLAGSYEQQIASADVLVEALGGVGPAMDALTFFTAEFVPEADRAATALSQARDGVVAFNDGLTDLQREVYGGVDGIVNTREEVYALWQSLDKSSDAAVHVLQFSGSVVELDNAAQQARIETESLAAAQVASLEAVTEAAGRLNLTFDSTTPLAGNAAEGLIELAGGMDAFQSANDKYFSSFYSQQEQQNIALAQSAGAVRAWNDTLSDADLALAGVKDGTIDSKNEFRNYVEALDLNTEAGARARTSALGVQDALIDVAKGGDSLDDVIEDLPRHLVGAGSVMENSMADTATELKRIADVLVNAFGDVGSGMVNMATDAKQAAQIAQLQADGARHAREAAERHVRAQIAELQAVGRRDAARVNGSHAVGLDRVPFDGYIAQLHKNEMVIPAYAAEIIRNLDASEAPGRVAANAAMTSSVAPMRAERDNGSAAMLAELRSLRSEVTALRTDRASDARIAEQQRGQITSGVQRTVAVTEKAAAETRRGYRQAALAAG